MKEICRKYHLDVLSMFRAWSEFVKKHKVRYNELVNGNSFVIRGLT